jgi:long-chain acyl-CoA synthetase
MKAKAPDLSPYSCLGEALKASLEKYAPLTALIEADRDRENCQITYSEFKQAALPLARTLQDLGFQPGNRAAIIMSNQSKWLISAYAVFYGGGILVPVDYKLTAREHLPILSHAEVDVLIIEYPMWRALTQTPGFEEHLNPASSLPSQQSPSTSNQEKPCPAGPPGGMLAPIVVVTEAPKNINLAPARRWEECTAPEEPQFIPRQRNDIACIVYSSGTGGNPKGCLLTHHVYLEQCQSLMTWYPFWPGVRYLSILPTNHAIDFMVGFIGPFVCGATVVHLRSLRPEYLKAAFPKYRITYVSLVPMVLKALENGLRTKLSELPKPKQQLVRILMTLNRWMTRRKPNPALSRKIFPQIHEAFGNELLTIITGGAFAEPSTLQFFYDLGIPVANGYGLTEAGTAITVNDLKPFRADTVGKPLPGFEVKLINCDPERIGEICVKSSTLMQGYLKDPELTAETFLNDWLRTGDLGRFDSAGHLHLFGRVKNMIVTEGGKNIYPEDIESVFDGLPVKEYCIFAANYIWKQRSLQGEKLVIVLHPEQGQEIPESILEEVRIRNRRLADFKRVNDYVVWEEDFPRTASLKIKRGILAEQLAIRLSRDTALKEL